MNFIDKAIKAISPERALKREVAKKRLSMINSGYGNYGASATKKSLIGWTHGGGSHREDVEDNIDPLRQRSRDLFYGGSNVATGAIKRLRTNTIGIGLHLKASINEEVLKIEPEEAKGTTEVVSVKHILVVTPKKLNPGKVATAAAAEVSGEYAVSYYATYIDGKKKLEIDPLNYIYYVNGKDYLADVRKALGK